MTDTSEWVTTEELAQILRVSQRQASRYAAQLRTTKAGKRILYDRAQAEALAKELGAANKAVIPPPTELVPIGDMMNVFQQQQSTIAQLSHEVGRLQGILETQRPQIEDTEAVRRRLIELESSLAVAQAEAERLRLELETAHERPTSWWSRIFGT